jgi:hypothetical protein
VVKALEQARDLVSGRAPWDPRKMPELSILAAETNLKLKTKVSIEDFAIVLLAESDQYCIVNRRGPKMEGTGGVEKIIAKSLQGNGGPTEDQKSGALTRTTQPDQKTDCGPRFMRLLDWKYSADGKGRWETYVTNGIRPTATTALKGPLGVAPPGSWMGGVLSVGGAAVVRYFGKILDLRKVNDREKLVEAMEAARGVVDSNSDESTDPAFNDLKPKDETPREFAALLVSHMNDLCTFDKEGHPQLPSSKDAIRSLTVDSAKGSGVSPAS